MKHLIFICSLLLIAPFLNSCSKSDPFDEPPATTDIELDLKSEQLIEADNAFGFDLFKEANAELSESKNLMISPLSISLAMAMIYNGANNDTKSQMESMLYKSGFSPDQINKAYQSLIEALANHDSKVKLSIANAIFYDQNFSVKPNFISANQTYYDAEVEELDFNNSSSTLDRVNGWVKNKTNNKISKIIDQVSPSDVMYLLNAIYFKGEWTYQFKKENTTDRAFYIENGTELQVPTMMLEETTLKRSSTNEFQLLELPYGGEKYSMLIFLPSEGYSTDNVIDGLNQDQLNNILANLHLTDVKVYLPKFEFAYENSLIDNLKALGMNDAFVSSLSDFSGISDMADLYISEVKHKSYIKVDEEGTEAAAVTGVTFGVTSAGPEPVFNVNRPFVFAIRETDTNGVLFMGKVNNPLLNE